MNGRETLFDVGEAAEVVKRVSNNLEVEMDDCPRIIVQSVKVELGHRDDPTEEQCASEFAFVSVNGVRAEDLGAEKVPEDLTKASAANLGHDCRHFVQGLDPLALVEVKIEPQEYYELACNESHTSASVYLGVLKTEPDKEDDELVHKRAEPTDITECLPMPASVHLSFLKTEPDKEDDEFVHERTESTDLTECLPMPASVHLSFLKTEPGGEDDKLLHERAEITHLKVDLRTPENNPLGDAGVSCLPVITTVEGEKPRSKCYQCDKQFTLMRALVWHIKHECGKVLSCPTCVKVFKWKCDLDRHVKHECGRVLRCSNCSKVFQQKRHFDFHVRHDCGKKLNCPMCSKPYKRKNDLEFHIKHECGKVLRCSCNRVFKRKHDLDFHMKHECGKDMRCPRCNKKYLSKAGFNSHVRNACGK